MCGIATFTKDLTEAINDQNPEALGEIIAMNDTQEGYDYPWEVKLRIDNTKPEDYIAAAQYINQSSADVVCLQHEFGLFGGSQGDFIVPMLEMITKPIVTNFHTIVPEPDEDYLYVMKRIIELSDAVVAMSSASAKDLAQQYDCDENKIAIIHHGVPKFALEDTGAAKKELGIAEGRMVMVSGLINPGKGFEYVIKAMPSVLEKFPDTQLYIVGQTHPQIRRRQKETYREQLLALIHENKLDDNVVLIDEFLELPKLTDYYRATDIYITPHLDPQQPTSGTLAKALGAGKVCISTPFFYAQEMLAEDTGILVPFADAESISKSICRVLGDEEVYKEYRRKAYTKGKMMQWPKIAKQYLDLYSYVIKKD